MIEVDGKYHVWTKRVGHGPVKMLTLHGGPEFPHDYFECFEDFLPQHGKALIISDMTAGIPAYEKYAATLLAELSEEDRKTLAKYEAAGQYEAPEYQQIMMGKVYAAHLRLDPWPEPAARAWSSPREAIWRCTTIRSGIFRRSFNS